MGYVLPDINTTETVCINLVLPNDPNLLRAFWAQLFELSRPWAWGLEPTNDVNEQAERRAVAYWCHDLYFSNRDANYEYVCPDEDDEAEDDTPWWDDAQSASGAGEGTKWGYEQIGDWAITAFLAVAGSPLAAVWYKTTVPRARLAFQSMDAGAMVNILIDGILFGAVSTASSVAGVAEIIEVPIDLDAFRLANGLGAENIIRLVAA